MLMTLWRTGGERGVEVKESSEEDEAGASVGRVRSISEDL